MLLDDPDGWEGAEVTFRVGAAKWTEMMPDDLLEYRDARGEIFPHDTPPKVWNPLQEWAVERMRARAALLKTQLGVHTIEVTNMGIVL